MIELEEQSVATEYHAQKGWGTKQTQTLDQLTMRGEFGMRMQSGSTRVRPGSTLAESLAKLTSVIGNVTVRLNSAWKTG